MRHHHYKGLFLIGIGAMTLSLSSCLKKFDPSSYMPEKSFGGFTNSNQIEPGHLVAYWSFNGNLNDSVSNGALTAVNNGCTFTAGVKGQALEVGNNNYLLFNNPGNVIPNLKSFTITFWYNAPQNTNNLYGILSIANSQNFWGNLDIFMDNGSTSSTSPFKVHMSNANAKNVDQWPNVKLNNPWGLWEQIAISYDSSSTASINFNIYQNGISVYSASLKDTTDNYGPLKFVNATAMVIGTLQFETNPSLTTATGSQPWAGSLNGALDEFRIYDKALTPGEVNSLFKLEKAGR